MDSKQDNQDAHIKNRKTEIVKKKFFRILVSCLSLLLFVFLIPVLINEAYKANTGYITIWGAEEVLSFYSVVLSGLITIAALIATIYYSKKDTERQIKFAQSQAHTPFFVIDRVCELCEDDGYKEVDGLKWEKEYVINRYKEDQRQIVISLKNIGDGIAIAPQYSVNSESNSDTGIPSVVGKDNGLKLRYNLSSIFTDINAGVFEPFDSCVVIYYQNILGINFRQELIIQHRWDSRRNTIIISVSSISIQKIEYK